MVAKKILLALALLMPPGTAFPGGDLRAAVTETPAQVFQRGYSLYNRGELLEARDVFLPLSRDEAFVLGDYVLYHLGRIAQSRQDHESARRWFARLRETYPGSIWLSRADIELAEMETAEGRFRAAVERLKRLSLEKTAKERRAEILYRLGEASAALGNLEAAHSHYYQTRRNSPRSIWAQRAKQRIRELRKRAPENFGLHTADSLLREVQLLMKESDYEEAEAVYLQLLETTNFRRLSLKGLSTLYRKTRQREKEEEVQKEIMANYPGTLDAGRAHARVAVIQWNRDDNTHALATFREFLRSYPGHPQSAFAEFAIGRIHESLAQWDKAIHVYAGFSNQYPHSRFRHDAAWRLAWIYYLKSQHLDARRMFQAIASRPNNYDAASMFWWGRVNEKLGRPDEARNLYRRLWQKPEDSYYRGLAIERLKAMGEPVNEKAPAAANPLPADGTAPLPALRTGSNVEFHLARGSVLAELSLEDLARRELDAVGKLSGHLPELRRLLMREYARIRAYDRSVALAHRLPFSEENRRYRFPLSYWDIVARYAKDHGVDPYLVVALIRQESLFNPRAVSPADAMGLMQLLPSTARFEARRMNLQAPSRRALFEPEINLRLGIHHLARLVQLYSGSYVKALAAYNAGKAAVARWENTLAVISDEEFVERIPYRETRVYVKLVLRNYRIYRELYPPGEWQRPRERGNDKSATDDGNATQSGRVNPGGSRTRARAVP